MRSRWKLVDNHVMAIDVCNWGLRTICASSMMTVPKQFERLPGQSGDNSDSTLDFIVSVWRPGRYIRVLLLIDVRWTLAHLNGLYLFIQPAKLSNCRQLSPALTYSYKFHESRGPL